jgi:hypothetical protein
VPKLWHTWMYIPHVYMANAPPWITAPASHVGLDDPNQLYLTSAEQSGSVKKWENVRREERATSAWRRKELSRHQQHNVDIDTFLVTTLNFILFMTTLLKITKKMIITTIYKNFFFLKHTQMLTNMDTLTPMNAHTNTLGLRAPTRDWVQKTWFGGSHFH